MNQLPLTTYEQGLLFMLLQNPDRETIKEQLQGIPAVFQEVLLQALEQEKPVNLNSQMPQKASTQFQIHSEVRVSLKAQSNTPFHNLLDNFETLLPENHTILEREWLKFILPEAWLFELYETHEFPRLLELSSKNLLLQLELLGLKELYLCSLSVPDRLRRHLNNQIPKNLQSLWSGMARTFPHPKEERISLAARTSGRYLRSLQEVSNFIKSAGELCLVLSSFYRYSWEFYALIRRLPEKRMKKLKTLFEKWIYRKLPGNLLKYHQDELQWSLERNSN